MLYGFGKRPGGPRMAKKYTLNEFCRSLGKAPPLVHQIQTGLGLHIPRRDEGYSPAYLGFMQKVVSLRTFSVPVADIADLFEKEKKILELLHVDSIADSPTWYLDACGCDDGPADNSLLLTGHNLGFPITAEVIQSNLDFRERDPELFTSREMGEDIRRVLKLYLKLLEKIKGKVETERPILEQALAWSAQAFWG
jgi:hypothetical protein